MASALAAARALGLAFALAGCADAVATQPTPPPAPVQPPAPAPAGPQWRTAAGIRYLEFTTGGAAPGDALPLLVYMHGLGDRPRGGWWPTLAVPARIVFPQAPTPYGRGFSWFDFHGTAGDPAGRARAISEAAAGVARMLQTLTKERPTLGRPVVSGFSQGGMLSYALALRHPESISRAIPVAGSLPPGLWKPAAKDPPAPIEAWHGDADDVVPLPPTQAMMASLSSHPGVRLHVIPGMRHSIPPTAMSQLQRAWALALRSEARPKK